MACESQAVETEQNAYDLIVVNESFRGPALEKTVVMIGWEEAGRVQLKRVSQARPNVIRIQAPRSRRCGTPG